MSKTKEYGAEVEAFIQQRLKDDPEGTKAILDKYPIVTQQKWKRIQDREIPSGLLHNQYDDSDDS